jgi:hypothetical protein
VLRAVATEVEAWWGWVMGSMVACASTRGGNSGILILPQLEMRTEKVKENVLCCSYNNETEHGLKYMTQGFVIEA